MMPAPLLRLGHSRPTPRDLGDVVPEAAMTEEIVMEQNTEGWELEGDYEGFARVKYVAECCPCEEECSKNSWAGAHCWSYEGPHKVRNYVCRHLKVSSRHYKPDDEAKLLAQYVNIREDVETFNEREEYRRAIAAAASQKRSRSGPPR